MLNTYKNNQDTKDSRVQWIGSIPKDWEVKKMKSFFYFPKERASIDSNDVLSLTQKGIKVRDITTNKGQLAASYENYAKLRVGDIVLNPMDLISGYVDLAKKEGVISPAYTILRKKKKVQVDLEYTNYFFQWHYLFEIFFPFGKGVSIDHRWTLGDDTLLNFPLLVPPSNISKQIADFLDEKTAKIDQIIEKKQKLIELLKEKRISIITQAVTKGLDPKAKMKPSGVEWIGEIPERWEITKIKHLSNVKRGASPRPIDNPDYFDSNGDYAWVRIEDVTSDGMYLKSTKQKLSELGSSLSVKLDEGSLFISIAGSVGKPCITKIKACIHDGFVYFPYLKFNNEYLYYIFEGGEAYQGLGKLGTQLNLNTFTIGEIIIPKPTTQEMSQIVNYLNTVSNKTSLTVGRVQKQLLALEEYRSSLIYNAVTGKIKL